MRRVLATLLEYISPLATLEVRESVIRDLDIPAVIPTPYKSLLTIKSKLIP